MNPASHDEIVGVLGEVDEIMLERIAQTGATVDEIAEAWAMVTDDGPDAPSPLSCTPRIAELRAILEEVHDELDEPDGEVAFHA